MRPSLCRPVRVLRSCLPPSHSSSDLKTPLNHRGTETQRLHRETTLSPFSCLVVNGRSWGLIRLWPGIDRWHGGDIAAVLLSIPCEEAGCLPILRRRALTLSFSHSHAAGQTGKPVPDFFRGE